MIVYSRRRSHFLSHSRFYTESLTQNVSICCEVGPMCLDTGTRRSHIERTLHVWDIISIKEEKKIQTKATIKEEKNTDKGKILVRGFNISATYIWYISPKRNLIWGHFKAAAQKPIYYMWGMTDCEFDDQQSVRARSEIRTEPSCDVSVQNVTWNV